MNRGAIAAYSDLGLRRSPTLARLEPRGAAVWHEAVTGRLCEVAEDELPGQVSEFLEWGDPAWCRGRLPSGG